MVVRFTKTGKKQNWVHARRPDDTTVSFPWPDHPGLPHDLIHLVVESVFDMRLGYWGFVASGVDFQILNGTVERARTGVKVRDLAGRDLRELFQAEALVACFTNEMLWGAPKTPTERREALGEACATWGVPIPSTYDDVLVERTELELQERSAQWERLDTGESLVLAFPITAA